MKGRAFMRKKLIVGIIGGIAFIIIALGILMNGSTDEKSSAFTELKATKEIKIETVEGEGHQVTGKDLTTMDMKIIAEELNSEQELPTFLVSELQEKMPVAFQEHVLGIVENNTYRQFFLLDESDEEVGNWTMIGEKSETKDGILTVHSQFNDENLSHEAILNQAKIIFTLIETLNEKKEYESKVIKIEVNDAESYIVEEVQPTFLQQITVF